jgi:hypothetical protein
LFVRARRPGPAQTAADACYSALKASDEARATEPEQAWAIAGHVIPRLDNGETLKARLLPSEVRVQM